MEVSYGNTIPWNFVVWYVEENFKPMNCNAAPMWRFLCAKQLKNVQVLEAEKKSAWTDLDRVDFEKKNFQRVNVQSEKSAWIGLGKVKKKGLFSGKCL